MEKESDGEEDGDENDDELPITLIICHRSQPSISYEHSHVCIYLYIHVSIIQSNLSYLSINPSIYLSIYLSIHPSIHPSIRPSAHLSINPSMLISIRVYQLSVMIISMQITYFGSMGNEI